MSKTQLYLLWKVVIISLFLITSTFSIESDYAFHKISIISLFLITSACCNESDYDFHKMSIPKFKCPECPNLSYMI